MFIFYYKSPVNIQMVMQTKVYQLMEIASNGCNNDFFFLIFWKKKTFAVIDVIITVIVKIYNSFGSKKTLLEISKNTFVNETKKLFRSP